jgi:hypothetical protein
MPAEVVKPARVRARPDERAAVVWRDVVEVDLGPGRTVPSAKVVSNMLAISE